MPNATQQPQTHREPSNLELALIERWNIHGVEISGPLTQAQAETEARYNAWEEESERESEREYEMEMRTGRVRCPSCDEFRMKQHVVNTGYDESVYGKCEGCGHEEFAG